MRRREDAPAELAAQLTGGLSITNSRPATRGAGGGRSRRAWPESATGGAWEEWQGRSSDAGQGGGASKAY
eukprot:1218242-Pyramimonas_sp.AAC.1